MKKIYKNQFRDPTKKVKKTKAQQRREWEHTVIGGGIVRASAFPRTANILNRGRGAVIRVIAVPLASEGQLDYLNMIADEGILGQTPEEVAAWYIREGILRDINSRSKCRRCGK